MVAITGPGDPLATPDITLQAIELVRARYPEVKIGLKTLGIGSAALAGKLARAGLNYVEMQVDGTKAAVLEKIYAWIRPGMKTLKISARRWPCSSRSSAMEYPPSSFMS